MTTNTPQTAQSGSLPRLVRLRCPDCKVTIERPSSLPAYESIECPRCERYIMRMFWITQSAEQHDMRRKR